MDIRRKDLVEKFYVRNAEILKSKTAAKAVFDDMFNMIEESLMAGDTVVVTGFGKFWVSHLKPRPVRNPIEGTTHMGVAKDAIRFTPSHVVQARLNASE